MTVYVEWLCVLNDYVCWVTVCVEWLCVLSNCVCWVTVFVELLCMLSDCVWVTVSVFRFLLSSRLRYLANFGRAIVRVTVYLCVCIKVSLVISARLSCWFWPRVCACVCMCVWESHVIYTRLFILSMSAVEDKRFKDFLGWLFMDERMDRLTDRQMDGQTLW